MSTIIPIVIGLALFLLSVLINKKDYYGLITGYNSLSNAEKELYGEAIAKDTSRILVVCGFISIALGFLFYFQVPNLIFVLLLDAIVLFIVYSLLKKREYSEASKNNLHKWVGAAFIIGLIIINILGYYSTSASTLVITNGKYEISGIYEIEDEVSNINKIELRVELPVVKSKLKGFAFNDIYKGRFSIGESTSAYLNLISSKPPYIYIESSKVGYIYFNTNSSEKTREYYYTILKIKNAKKNK